jgi:hypothetical protein
MAAFVNESNVKTKNPTHVNRDMDLTTNSNDKKDDDDEFKYINASMKLIKELYTNIRIFLHIYKYKYIYLI